jgi:Berberine and berberine like
MERHDQGLDRDGAGSRHEANPGEWGLLRLDSSLLGERRGDINFMSGDDDHQVAANCGANYERPSAVKAAYDPDNLFHVNQNIAPAKRR